MFTSIKIYFLVILAYFSSEGVVQDNAFKGTQHVTKCGRSKIVTVSPLVINGTEAHVGSFPWHAGLYYRTVTNNTVSWEQRCGGSLITDRFILSAAHCVYNSKEVDIRVALGKSFRSWDHIEIGEQKRNVSRISFPYDFNTQTYYFDIALLQLDEKINLGELIMPVCTGLMGDSNYLFNKSLYVVGWGQTKNVWSGSASETLLYNDVAFMPPRACMQYTPYTYVLFEKFCTKKYDSDVSVAQPGDSGGGLTVVHDGLHYILGIVSVKFGLVGQSRTFFTNISWPNHLFWIHNEIREYDNKFKWAANVEETNQNSRPPADVAAKPVTQIASETASNASNCKLPEKPRKGGYVSLGCSSNNRLEVCHNKPGTVVTSDWTLKYTCDSGYSLTSDSQFSICNNGVWQNPLDCIKVCPPLDSPRVNIKCLYGGTEVNCSLPMKPLTEATAVCKPQYKEALSTDDSYRTCLNTGEWSSPLPSCTPACGLVDLTSPQSLILNGVPAKIGEFPWLAAIYINQYRRWEQVCGGTLITTHIVVTGAHCLAEVDDISSVKVSDKSTIKVGLGKLSRDYYKNDETSIMSDVKEVFIPTNYFGGDSLYTLDIGLLDLVVSVRPSPTIMPACVDWSGAFKPAADAVGLFAGWGSTELAGPSSEIALSTRLKYINYSECFIKLRGSLRPSIPDSHFCGGSINGGDLAKGDTGGGLTFLKDGIYYLVGIASLRLPQRSFTLFADITHEVHITWLEKIKSQLS